MKGNAADRERYTYDADGNITAIHENGKLKVRYHYDGLNRLVREDNQPLKLTTTYTYDNGGNLLRQNEYAYSLSPTDELANGTEVVYTYGNENHPDQLTNYNGKAIVYNANGYPTNYLGNACTYEGGRLKTFGSNTFDYDADGLRTKKNNIVYTYIDGRLVQQSGNSKPPLDFIYGPTGLVGFKYDNILYLYRRNQMGDVTHIYNTAGTLLAKYEYDAWGNHTVTKMGTNAIGDINPIRYRGYYYDKETGLYYLQSRYYDPETGRFLSQDDTAYLAPESLTGLNLYAYCNNNPVMYRDPSGCLALATLLIIGVIAGATIGGGIYGGIAAGMSGGSVGDVFAGIGKGALSGFMFGSSIGLVIGGFLVGAASVLGSTMIFYGLSTTANMIEVETIQRYKSNLEGLSYWSVENNVINAWYANIGRVYGGYFSDLGLYGTRLFSKAPKITNFLSESYVLSQSYSAKTAIPLAAKGVWMSKAGWISRGIGFGATVIQFYNLYNAITNPDIENSKWILY